MATFTINVPNDFARNLKDFMDNVQKMQQFADKLMYVTKNLPQAQSLVLSHQSVTSRLSRMLQTLRKVSAGLQRAIDSIINAMGAAAQSVLRGLSIAAEALGPIIGTTIAITGMAISAGLFAAGLSYRIGRWIWNKMVSLGDSMLQDFLTATGSLSTIGGIRAFRTAFGMLPDDPGAVPAAAQARGSIISKQFAAMRLLGVQARNDSMDMMVQATLAASRFMKAQRQGQELLMADAFVISSLIGPDRLLALQNMSEEELLRAKKMYDSYKPLMQVSDKAIHGWINFRLQLQVAGAQITSVIAETLADPTAPFTQAMQKLSESLVHFFKIMMDTPVTEKIIKTLGDYIDKFAKWLGKPETAKTITDLAKKAIDIVKYVIQAISLLKDIMRDWISGPPREVVYGRRALARRVGIDRAPTAQKISPTIDVRHPGRAKFFRKIGVVRPVDAPPAARPSEAPIARYPGRARFHERIGIERKPTEQRIAPRPAAQPRVARESTYDRLRVPKKLEEAPETIKEAQKGGFVRGGGEIDRSRFAQELQAKPWLRDKILRIAANEQGSNPQGTQAVLESMMNRAEVRGTSLEQQAKWVGERGYYAQGNMGAGALENSKHRAILEQSLNKTLGGSNISNYATDNASQGLAERRKAADPGSFRQTYGGESFFSPPPDQLGNRKKYLEWRQGLKPGGKIPWSVQDIQNMDKGDVSKLSQQPMPQPARGGPAGGVPWQYERRRGEPGEFNYAATGELGPVGPQNQTQIQLKNGKVVTVNKYAADRYKGFLNELIDRGYPVNDVGGYNYREKRGGGGVSMHSYGAAVDVNPDKNAFRGRTTDLPKDVEEMAWRHGLSWGGRFGDPMHFEVMSNDAWQHKLLILKDQGKLQDSMPSADTKPFPEQSTGQTPYSQSAFQPKQDTPWPSYKPKAWDDHPIQKLKIDNRSDLDISHAKTHSDNDNGDSHPADSGTALDQMPADL